MAETSPQIELSQEQLSVIKGRLDQLDTSLNTRRRMDDIRLVALGGLVPLLCLGLVVIVAILVIPDLSAIQLKGVDDGDFMKLAVPIFTLAFGFVVGILGLKRFEQFDQEIARLRESLDRRALEERTMRAEEFRDFQARIQDGEAALLKKVATIEEQLVEELRSQRDEARQQRAELRNSLVKSQKEADERTGLFQQKLEQDSRLERADARKQQTDERADFRRDFEDRLEAIRNEVGVLAQNSLEKAVKEQKKDLRQLLDASREDADERIGLIQQKLEPYAWLEERRDDIESLTDVETVGVAHERFVELFFGGKKDLALRIAKRVCELNLPGSRVDYHNLAASLAQRNYDSQALEVVKIGLARFPQDTDLIADGIQHAFDSGDLETATEIVQKLQEVPEVLWNWRAYSFYANLLLAEGQIEEGKDVYRRFREAVPEEERAYSGLASHYRNTQQIGKAIAVLEEGLEACRWAPQCSSMLSDLLREIGEYEKAIAAADRGVEATAEEQPSAKQSFLIWHRALAKDALFHQLFHELPGDASESDTDSIAAHAEGAIDDYALTMEMEDVPRILQNRGKDRISILTMSVQKLDLSPERQSSLQRALDRFRSIQQSTKPQFPPELLQQLAAGLGGGSDD